MNQRKTRKQSFNKRQEFYTRRSSVPNQQTFKSTISRNDKNKNGLILPAKYEKPSYILNRIREVDQQMKELFIVDENIEEFSSKLKSALLSGTKTSQLKSKGDTFFSFWNSYVQSITVYLQQPPFIRCLQYVIDQFNLTKEIILDLFSKLDHIDQKQKSKIEKTDAEINGEIAKLQNLIDTTKLAYDKNHTLPISKISDMTYPFDCFYHDVISKYTLFFEYLIPEKTQRDPILKDLYKSVKSIVDCTFAASKMDEIKKSFIHNLNETSDIFNQIFKRVTKNLSSTESKVTHKHRNSAFVSKNMGANSPQNRNIYHRNKTDIYVQIKNKYPRQKRSNVKSKAANDDSSSGKDKLISMAVPSESVEDSTKILPKSQRVATLSRSKYEHLNKRFVPDQDKNNKQKHQEMNGSPNSLNNNILTFTYKKEPKKPKSFMVKNSTNSIVHNNGGYNQNNSVKKSIDSQLYDNKYKEAKLIAQLDSIISQNNEIKAKHQQLLEQLNRHSQQSKIDALNDEINILKISLEQNDVQINNDIFQEIQTLRSIVDITRESVELYSDEIEPCKQINRCLSSSNDDTVTFDNLRLRKLCDNLNERIKKLQYQLIELKNQKNRFFFLSEINRGNQLDSEGEFQAYALIKYDTEILQQENIKLENSLNQLLQESPHAVFETDKNSNQLSFSPASTASFTSIQTMTTGVSGSNSTTSTKFASTADYIKESFGNTKKIQQRIKHLSDTINSLRRSRGGDVYALVLEELSKMKTRHQEIKKLDHELSHRIEKLNSENERLQMKRKIFDDYEQLKERARELQIEYFDLKKNITNNTETSEKYHIELQMDDIQDQYTTVMMEIERLGGISTREKLHECRKDRVRTRREMAKYIEQEYSVAFESLEAERHVAELEKEVKNLMSRTKDKDEVLVTKLAETLTEAAQTKEILNIIDEQTKQFNIELDIDVSTTERQRIEDLKETLEIMIKNGGNKMKQKLRIYNLQKEIELLRSQ